MLWRTLNANQGDAQRKAAFRALRKTLPDYDAMVAAFRKQCRNVPQQFQVFKQQFIDRYAKDDPIVHRVASALMDHVVFVSLDTFTRSLTISLKQLAEKMSKAGVLNYILVLNAKEARDWKRIKGGGQKKGNDLLNHSFYMKSNLWLSGKIADVLYTASKGQLVMLDVMDPADAEDVKRIKSVYARYHHRTGACPGAAGPSGVPHLLIFDDAVYSGQQIKALQKKTREIMTKHLLSPLHPFNNSDNNNNAHAVHNASVPKFQLWVGAVYWSPESLIEGAHDTGFHMLPLARDVFDLLNIENPTNYGGEQKQCMYIFEHKLPDYASFPAALVTGEVLHLHEPHADVVMLREGVRKKTLKYMDSMPWSKSQRQAILDTIKEVKKTDVHFDISEERGSTAPACKYRPTCLIVNVKNEPQQKTSVITVQEKGNRDIRPYDKRMSGSVTFHKHLIGNAARKRMAWLDLAEGGN